MSSIKVSCVFLFENKKIHFRGTWSEICDFVNTKFQKCVITRCDGKEIDFNSTTPSICMAPVFIVNDISPPKLVRQVGLYKMFRKRNLVILTFIFGLLAYFKSVNHGLGIAN